MYFVISNTEYHHGLMYEAPVYEVQIIWNKEKSTQAAQKYTKPKSLVR